MTKRYYVGVKGKRFEKFLSEKTPTSGTHGDKYVSVIGPFRSKAGATIMEKYGYDNPHVQSVAQAELLAKRHPEMLK